MAKYLKKIKDGEGLKHAIIPGWRRSIKKVTLKGESASTTVKRMRHEEWR